MERGFLHKAERTKPGEGMQRRAGGTARPGTSENVAGSGKNPGLGGKLDVHIFVYLFAYLFSFFKFDRQRNREYKGDLYRHRELPSNGSLPKCPQDSTLG